MGFIQKYVCFRLEESRLCKTTVVSIWKVVVFLGRKAFILWDKNIDLNHWEVE